MQIKVINTNSCNLNSLINVINNLGHDCQIINKEKDLQKKSKKIIIPGVGSYSSCMDSLKKIKFKEYINKNKNLHILGICVGMQVLSSFGYEDKKCEGLNLIKGKVFKLETKLPLPHLGWNSINVKKKNLLVDKNLNKKDFFFMHSYVFIPEKKKTVLTETTYGKKFVSGLNEKNIYGVQFHPEKSSAAGKEIIKNFINLK